MKYGRNIAQYIHTKVIRVALHSIGVHCEAIWVGAAM